MEIGDIHSFVLLILSVACSILGWFAKQLYYSVDKLKEDLNKLSENVSEKYLRKDDYRDDMHDIKEMLNKIFERLDSKQDK